jgi:hypothetical protein
MSSAAFYEIEGLRLGDWPRPVQEKVIEQFGEEIVDTMVNLITKHLPPAQGEVFDIYLEAAETRYAGIRRFITKRAPQMDYGVTEVASRLAAQCANALDQDFAETHMQQSPVLSATPPQPVVEEEPLAPGFKELVAELDIGMLPRHNQEEIIGRLGETIMQATVITIVERLSWRGRKKFERYLDNAPDPIVAMQTFLATEAPHLGPVVEAVRRHEIALIKEAVAKA